MWASDYTQARNEMPITWAQALYYILDSDRLSETEKESVLGKQRGGCSTGAHPPPSNDQNLWVLLGEDVKERTLPRKIRKPITSLIWAGVGDPVREAALMLQVCRSAELPGQLRLLDRLGEWMDGLIRAGRAGR